MSRRPPPSSALVSRNMKKVKVRDTGPEMAIRRLLFSSRLHYRVNYNPKSPDVGRSTIDIAFPGRHLAIFIDGCFWHGCPEHGSMPKANQEWWRAKLVENTTRDKRVTEQLESGGWTVLRFWSHEEPETVHDRIMKELDAMGTITFCD